MIPPIPLDPTTPEECFEEYSIWTSWMHPGCGVQSVAGAVVENAALKPFVEDAKQGVTDTVKTMVTFWVSVPPPQLTDADGSPSDPVTFLSSNLTWLAAVIMAFTMLVGGIIIVLTNRAEPARLIGQMLLTYIIMEALLAGAVAAALNVTSAVSAQIIGASTDGTNFADNIIALFNTTQGVGSGLLLIVLLLLAALIAAFTCFLMIARGGILICLVGAAPLAVALSGVQFGVAILRHYVAWIAAFVLYQLAAAIVYSVGFRLAGTDTSADGNSMLQILYGLTLLGMAVLALPAVIRLVVPAVAPVATGRGVGAMGAGVAAAGATALVRR